MCVCRLAGDAPDRCFSVRRNNSFPAGQTPWPPLRIPTEPMDAYKDIYKLLSCKAMIGLCFNLLYKVM